MSDAVELDGLRRRVLGELVEERPLADLAERLEDRLEVTDARLLWHLRRLRDAGLTAYDEDSGLWARTAEGAEAAELPGGQPLAALEGQAFSAGVVADFAQAVAEKREGLYGEDVVLRSGESRCRMTREQAAEFGDRLERLVAECFGPGQGDRSGVKYGFTWILTPIDLHPLGDD